MKDKRVWNQIVATAERHGWNESKQVIPDPNTLSLARYAGPESGWRRMYVYFTNGGKIEEVIVRHRTDGKETCLPPRAGNVENHLKMYGS